MYSASPSTQPIETSHLHQVVLYFRHSSVNCEDILPLHVVPSPPTVARGFRNSSMITTGRSSLGRADLDRESHAWLWAQWGARSRGGRPEIGDVAYPSPPRRHLAVPPRISRMSDQLNIQYNQELRIPALDQSNGSNGESPLSTSQLSEFCGMQ